MKKETTTNRRGAFRALIADQLHQIGPEWELIETYEVERVVLVYEDAIVPAQANVTPNGYNPGPTKMPMVGRQVVVRNREFLFFLSDDAVESKMAKDLEAARLERNALAKELAAEKVTAAKLRQEHAQEVQHGADMKCELAMAGSVNDSWRAKANKLEGDIATITKEIGAGRIKEILGGAQ